MRGKYSQEQIAAAQREFEGQIKLANVVIQAYAVASKNARTLKGLENMNLMDGSTAVNLGLGPAELDCVKCPLKEGAIITRSECMDLNGTKENYTYCRTCENKGITAKMLAGDKQ